MCGRFDVDQSNREIDQLLRMLPPERPPVKRGEVFPANPALTLVLKDSRPTPEALVWGFPRWNGKGVIFNARGETALQKAMFANALKNNPAVIPATGFYEWRPDPLLGKKEKFLFKMPGQAPLYMAAFWKNFPDNPLPGNFVILTTTANDTTREYHQRMPVLLAEDEIEAWLSGAKRDEILSRIPFSLEAHRAPGRPESGPGESRE